MWRGTRADADIVGPSDLHDARLDGPVPGAAEEASSERLRTAGLDPLVSQWVPWRGALAGSNSGLAGLMDESHWHPPRMPEKTGTNCMYTCGGVG